MLVKRGKRAQTTAEYAVLLSLVIAAVLAMQVYVKRGIQARVKDGTDYLANQTSNIGNTTQYEPYYLTSNATTTQTATDFENLQLEGGVDRTIDATTNVTRNQIVGW